MRWLSFFFVSLLIPNLWAGEFVFQDSDCKVLSPNGSKVKVTEGEKSEYTCVSVGNEASCHYKNLATGKSQGQPTRFEVIDLDRVQIWSSVETGNVKMLIDEEGKSFIFGVTAILPDRGAMLSKQCVGTKIRQVK